MVRRAPVELGADPLQPVAWPLLGGAVIGAFAWQVACMVAAGLIVRALARSVR